MEMGLKQSALDTGGGSKQKIPSPRIRHQTILEAERRKKFMIHARGKCLNCLSPHHRVASCRNLTRCWRCLNQGHRARDCIQFKKLPTPTTRQHHQTPQFQPQPSKNQDQVSEKHRGKRSYLEVVKGVGASMAYPGDPLARPGRELRAVSTTGAIRRVRDDLVSRAAVCSLPGNSHDTEPHHVSDALAT